MNRLFPVALWLLTALAASANIPRSTLALTSQPIAIDHYYDPEHEFLETGVSENGRFTWKILGPDLNGRYGGQNGTGGFDAIVPGPELFCPLLSDAHGNLHAIFDQGHSNLVWYPSRVTGYGAVPGYRPVPLGQIGADLGAKYVYRNRATTSWGGVWMGGNWYDPQSGQFFSPDPAGHAGSPSLYSFCHGDPINFWDADGRLGKEWKPFDGALEEASQRRRSFEERLRLIVGASGGVGEPPQRPGFASRFWDQVFLGDYALEDNGAAGILGQTAAGLTPLGPVGDIRDLTAAVNDIDNQGWSWGTGGGLVLSAAAFIPGAGDLAKGLLKPVLRRIDNVPTSGITPPNGNTFDATFEMPQDWPGQRMTGMHQDHAIPRALDPNNPTINASENLRPMPAAMNSVDKAPFDAELAQRYNQLVRDVRRYENVSLDQAQTKAWQAMAEEIRAHANSVPARPMDPKQLDQLPRR